MRQEGVTTRCASFAWRTVWVTPDTLGGLQGRERESSYFVHDRAPGEYFEADPARWAPDLGHSFR